MLGDACPALAHVLRGGTWDADGFVDLVERVHDGPPDDPLRDAAVRLQRLEWERLFGHCVRQASPLE
jgi:hypothetical protein